MDRPTASRTVVRLLAVVATLCTILFAWADPSPPVVEEDARLGATDSSTDDSLGISAALSGETAVVGAWGDDHAGVTDAGSAYVFVRRGDTWLEQAKLTAGNPETYDYFGYSVAISGDTVVVGDLHEVDAVAGGAGAAHVFVRRGNTWSERARLTARDALPGDMFGTEVAISGDTAVVGAPYGHHALYAGAAYVFVRRGTRWLEEAKLTASDAVQSDNFGLALATSGDTIVVGAMRAGQPVGIATGAAYVFVRRGGAWFEQARLTASDAQLHDQFGKSVAISGDTVVVGAWEDDVDGVPETGSAYVFVRHGDTWTEQGKLTVSGQQTYAQAGFSVAVSGDAAVVGAWRDDDDGEGGAGAAYLFVRSGDVWTERAKLTTSDSVDGNYLGTSVALSGQRAIVGAPGIDLDGEFDAGSAYVFELERSEPGRPLPQTVFRQRGTSRGTSR